MVWLKEECFLGIENGHPDSQGQEKGLATWEQIWRESKPIPLFLSKPISIQFLTLL